MTPRHVLLYGARRENKLHAAQLADVVGGVHILHPPVVLTVLHAVIESRVFGDASRRHLPPAKFASHATHRRRIVGEDLSRRLCAVIRYGFHAAVFFYNGGGAADTVGLEQVGGNAGAGERHHQLADFAGRHLRCCSAVELHFRPAAVRFLLNIRGAAAAATRSIVFSCNTEKGSEFDTYFEVQCIGNRYS